MTPARAAALIAALCLPGALGLVLNAPVAGAQSGQVEAQVLFPGLTGVHVYAYAADGVEGSYSGPRLASATWRSDEATLSLAPGSYDFRMVDGPAEHVLDEVDCTSGCEVAAPLVTLTASFPGLNNVHTYAHLDDGAGGSVGAQVASSTWQSNEASLVLLEGSYDVRVVHGPATYIADAIDCGACAIDVPIATLDVSFPGLNSTHVYAHMPDGAAETYGQQVLGSTWNSESTSLVLMQGEYDLRIVHGPAVTVLDAVDCRAATCAAVTPLATLTIDFPGLASAHMYAHLADGLDATYGQQVLSSTWKSDTTSMVLLRGMYDVRAVHGPAVVVLNDVDCRAERCDVAVPLTTLTASFMGLSNAHVYAHLDDAAPGSYGPQVASSTWKSDSTSLVLLQGSYDVRVVQGPATTVLDGVACTTDACSVDVPLAELRAEFAGRSNVHTYVHIPDATSQVAGGQQVLGSTWKTDSTRFTVLRGVYDVRFVQASTTSVADDVDCTGPACMASLDAAIAAAAATATPTATPVPPTSTPVPAIALVPAVEDGSALVEKVVFSVDYETGVVTWIVRPTADDTRIFVWDAAAESCRAFGGGKCGGIAGNGKPGEFKKNKGEDQHLFVTQSFEPGADGTCLVENTVEWALNNDAGPSERESVTAVFDCPRLDVPGLVTKELYTVDEDAGVIVWILRPTEEGVRIYVWDEMAESCQAFGGARCGGIAGNGKPGEFKKNKGEEQHLFISQSFKVDESNHCEDVVNTVEWSLSKDAAPSEREFQTAVYKCSGANALGWPLLIVAFGLAVGVAWLVQKRITWLRP